MTIDDILTLARAGYTSEQINALYTVQAQAPVQAPVQAPTATLDDVMRGLAGLTTAVQANALLGAQQPAQPTVNDVLAQIIAPDPPKQG
nr:MAG TPA: hypothetical protein [Caudoviricetes sp.]